MKLEVDFNGSSYIVAPPEDLHFPTYAISVFNGPAIVGTIQPRVGRAGKFSFNDSSEVASWENFTLEATKISNGEIQEVNIYEADSSSDIAE